MNRSKEIRSRPINQQSKGNRSNKYVFSFIAPTKAQNNKDLYDFEDENSNEIFIITRN